MAARSPSAIQTFPAARAIRPLVATPAKSWPNIMRLAAARPARPPQEPLRRPPAALRPLRPQDSPDSPQAAWRANWRPALKPLIGPQGRRPGTAGRRGRAAADAAPPGAHGAGGGRPDDDGAWRAEHLGAAAAQQELAQRGFDAAQLAAYLAASAPPARRSRRMMPGPATGIPGLPGTTLNSPIAIADGADDAARFAL